MRNHKSVLRVAATLVGGTTLLAAMFLAGALTGMDVGESVGYSTGIGQCWEMVP